MAGLLKLPIILDAILENKVSNNFIAIFVIYHIPREIVWILFLHIIYWCK